MNTRGLAILAWTTAVLIGILSYVIPGEPADPPGMRFLMLAGFVGFGILGALSYWPHGPVRDTTPMTVHRWTPRTAWFLIALVIVELVAAFFGYRIHLTF